MLHSEPDAHGPAAGEPAVMLTDNRPLVQVRRGALIADARVRSDNGSARRAVQALRTLLGYLMEHAEEDASSPEHAVVFDEAQRPPCRAKGTVSPQPRSRSRDPGDHDAAVSVITMGVIISQRYLNYQRYHWGL